MEKNDSKVSSAKVFSMFMAIRTMELKNVRTLEYDDKGMAKRLAAYILNQAREDNRQK